MPYVDASPRTLLLAGATATGKTALAVRLARRLGGEIVSADSMQVYRGCAVASAQPTSEELQGVPCHLVDCVAPDADWTTADWLRATRRILDEIHARGRLAVVAGGTGLYFKALTSGLFEGPPGAGRPQAVRRRLEAAWDAPGGAEALRRRLGEADPAAAARIHPNDRVRIVRALEVFEATGRALSALQAASPERDGAPGARRFVLTAERARLYARIDARVERMVAAGLREEVEALLAAGAREEWPAMRALGCRQTAAWIRGRMTRGEAVEETQRQSRRYAKRQVVLFRQWPGALWLDVARGEEKTADLIEKSLEFCPGRGF